MRMLNNDQTEVADPKGGGGPAFRKLYTFFAYYSITYPNTGRVGRQSIIPPHGLSKVSLLGCCNTFNRAVPHGDETHKTFDNGDIIM